MYRLYNNSRKYQAKQIDKKCHSIINTEFDTHLPGIKALKIIIPQ